ncbi:MULTISPECIES: glycosyltransferase family 2 protein [unclassified Nocardioides]|uniref:glycosyltransferase family 2 protein n=1 Tax=unclassified Nocardioides TaxID=2615069 RepID=UPI00361D01D2
MTTTPPYRISLAMIARDEARSIGRCLESVRDVVDEMVVVDTGSLDDTVAIAEAAGATVHHFTWVDDFATARNEALALCTGDWRLVLDADEWLASGAEALSALREVNPSFGGIVEIASVSDNDVVSLLPQVRVLPADAYYVGRVHEQPQVAGEPRPLAVRIDHDGYLPEQREKKLGRNRRLLELALVEDPENPYLWFQLACDHDQAASHASACLGYERADQLMTGPDGPDATPWRHHLVVRYVASLVLAQRTQDAIDLSFRELETWQHSADFQFVLGHALLHHAMANPELGDDILPLVEQAWQTCLALGDSDLPGATVGHGGYLAARELVRLYETLGREADAARFRPLAEKL